MEPKTPPDENQNAGNQNEDTQPERKPVNDVIKIKLKKKWCGRGPGRSVRATKAQLKKSGLKEGEDYRVVGAFKEPTVTDIEELITTR